MQHFEVKKLKKTVWMSILVSFFMTLSLSAGHMKIMPLGDSITEGQDPSDVPAEDRISYRGPLWSKLKNKNYDFDFVGTVQTGSNYDPDFDQDHDGFGGKKTWEIEDEIDGYLDTLGSALLPDIILLHIGTNDLTLDGYDVNVSTDHVKSTLDKIFARNANAKILLARIITSGDADASVTTDFNDHLVAMVDAHDKTSQITMVNMETGADMIYDTDHDMYDTLHPNETGYEKMATKWFSELEATGLLTEINNNNNNVSLNHHWTLNEAGAPFVDVVGSSNGSCEEAGCSSQTAGQIDHAQAFVDGDKGITVADDDSFDWGANDDFTVEAWIKPSAAASGNDVVIGRYDDNDSWWVGMNGSKVKTQIGSVTVSSTVDVDVSGDVWTHVAVVREAGKVKIYLNGQEDLVSTESDTTDFALTAEVSIGWFLNDNFDFTGAIDDVKVYTGAVTAADIQQHYNDGIAANTGKPLITLTGDATVNLTVGDAYTDAGATANDDEDGNITASVVVAGDTVDTATAGTYTVTYNVTDSDGNAADEVTRTVIVSEPVVTTLTHHWTLNEAEAPFIDAVGSRDGSADANSSSQTAGQIDHAQAFVDGDKGITVADDDSFDWGANDDFTVEAWIKPSAVSGLDVFIGRYNGDGKTWWIALDGSKIKVEMGSFQETGTAEVDVSGDVWTHVAVAREAGKVKIYLNGQLDKESTESDTTDFTATSEVNIGWFFNNDYDFNGALDDVKVYTGAVTAADIQQHYNDGQGAADETVPVITLTGAAAVTLTVGDAYTDAGATANDNKDGDITANIVTVNPVNTSAEGNYTVTYNVDDAAGNHAVEVTRAVEVKAAAQVDETVPVITLTGAAAVTLTVGDTYTDAGATANDNKDGDITANIVTVNSVNTSAEGNYTVTYNVDDDAGNHAVEVTRAVEVKAAVDTTAPVITLTGSNPMTITVGGTFTDPGATAEDNKDGDISANIVIDASTVDTSAEGNYTVTYNVDDAAGNHAVEVTRTVEVVVAGTADTTKPTIILTGDATVTLTVGDAYTDAGATASDNVDGDITGNIQTVSTVDTATAGTYTVTYDVNDTAGNTANTVTRTVIVNTDETDTDGDGIPDVTDDDDDNDGVLDENDAFPLDASESVDTDGDGIGNNADTDDDDDGVLDENDAFPLDKNESVDTDGDGIGDNADPDDDNNGIADVDEKEWFDYTDGKVTASESELSVEGVTHEIQTNADSVTLFHALNGGNGCQAYVKALQDGKVETGYKSCANGDDATLEGAANAGTHAKIMKENGKIVIETTLELPKDGSFIIGGK